MHVVWFGTIGLSEYHTFECTYSTINFYNTIKRLLLLTNCSKPVVLLTILFCNFSILTRVLSSIVVYPLHTKRYLIFSLILYYDLYTEYSDLIQYSLNTIPIFKNVIVEFIHISKLFKEMNLGLYFSY